MNESEGLKQLHDELKESADERLHRKERTYLIEALAEEYLERLAEHGVVEDYNVCYLKSGSSSHTVEVHGYALNEVEHRLDLYLVIHKWKSDPEMPRVTRQELQGAIRKLNRLVQRLKKGTEKEMEPSAEAAGMLKSAAQALKGGFSVRFLIVADCQANAEDISEPEKLEPNVRVDVWDLVRLYRASQSKLDTEIIEIDMQKILGHLLPCLPMPTPTDEEGQEDSAEYQAYLAIIPGRALANLYELYGGRLMELNVRSFLQARGKVNSGIKKTLVEVPSRFLAYNNGISATVNQLKTEHLPDGSLGISYMRGLQIVNGGQTTASIHNVYKREKTDISKVFVPMKITVLQESQYEEFVPLISRYANTQNVVQMADFSANNGFHVDIERLADSVWCDNQRQKWFYERARGAYQVTLARAGTPQKQKKLKEQIPPNHKLSKTDVARCLVAWEMKPFRVCEGAQKNFVKFMEERTQKNTFNKPDERFFKTMVAKHILFRDIQEVVRKAGLEAYRAQVVAYLVSYLAHILNENKLVLDFQCIWNRQQLSAGLKIFLQSWVSPLSSKIIQSARKWNVTEWCKKDACWAAIKELTLPLPDEEERPEEIRDQKDGDDVVIEALLGDISEMENRVTQLDADAWEDLGRKGRESGKLNNRQQQLAHTLARRAATGWKPKLKTQQIIDGAKILRILEDE